MKKPRLFNLAAGVSLLLAIVIVVLWVRSYWRHVGITRYWHTSTDLCSWDIHSFYGSLYSVIRRFPDKGRLETPIYKYWGTDPGNMPRFHWFPFPPAVFGYISHAGGPFEERTVSIAYWLLLLPTLPLPLIAIVHHRRRRQRETNNLCPACGYDLRATPDRCPECGTSPPPARAVT